MQVHLEALVLLERVWGALGLITSASLLLLAAGTKGALEQQGVFGATNSGPLWLLAGCGVLMAVVSVAALSAASGLRRRRAGGRLAALILAIPNLFILPFGTALAVYTLWVLLNDDARREFGRPLRGPALTDLPR